MSVLPESRLTDSRVSFERRGNGPTLVLLHPLGANRRVWDPVVPLLEGARDLILVDLPGFGESVSLPSEVVPFPAALAGAVHDLLRELALAPDAVHVAGNSLGGWVALELAARGQVASVTAIAPAGLWPRALAPKPEVARRLARLALPGVSVAMRSERLRRIALAGTVGLPSQVSAAEAAALVQAYAAAPGFSAVNRAMRSSVFHGLEGITVPVTLVWPELDRLITRPKHLPEWVEQIELPDCGHLPMWDDPSAVATVLLKGSVAR